VAKQVLFNTRIFSGGSDLTGATNKVELDDQFEVKDATTFGSGGAKEVLAGLQSCAIAASGFWGAGDLTQVDDAMWAARAGALVPWTVPPNTANVGDLAWLTKGLQSDYKLLGQVGDIAPWAATAVSDWPLVRGQILHPPGTARTATGSGTARQIGALAAGQSLYCCLHVLSVAGTATPTLTVTVESDNSSGFASPVTVGTFTAATAVGGQTVEIVGAVTDDWYRVKYTITGTTPSFLFVVSAGIDNT
jgi:hypothetical protein